MSDTTPRPSWRWAGRLSHLGGCECYGQGTTEEHGALSSLETLWRPGFHQSSIFREGTCGGSLVSPPSPLGPQWICPIMKQFAMISQGLKTLQCNSFSPESEFGFPNSSWGRWEQRHPMSMLQGYWDRSPDPCKDLFMESPFWSYQELAEERNAMWSQAVSQGCRGWAKHCQKLLINSLVLKSHHPLCCERRYLYNYFFLANSLPTHWKVTPKASWIFQALICGEVGTALCHLPPGAEDPPFTGCTINNLTSSTPKLKTKAQEKKEHGKFFSPQWTSLEMDLLAPFEFVQCIY